MEKGTSHGTRERRFKKLYLGAESKVLDGDEIEDAVALGIEIDGEILELELEGINELVMKRLLFDGLYDRWRRAYILQSLRLQIRKLQWLLSRKSLRKSRLAASRRRVQAEAARPVASILPVSRRLSMQRLRPWAKRFQKRSSNGSCNDLQT